MTTSFSNRSPHASLLLRGLRSITLLGAAALMFPIVPNALAATVQLAWIPNSESTLAGYKIHYGQSSRSYSASLDTVDKNTCSIGDLQPGRTYYFAATAYDVHGDESDYSNEISYSVPHSAPFAQDATLAGTEDMTASGVLRANDPEGQSLKFTIVVPPTNGKLSLSNAATGAFTYSPNPDFNGEDTFTFKAHNDFMDSNVARVSVNVAPVNDHPVAFADQGTTTQRTSIMLDLLSNDRDLDGDVLSISSVTQGRSGRATLLGKQVQYTPNATFSGADTFSYTISDQKGGTASAGVTIQVLSANKPPVASDGRITASPGVTVNGALSASDPDGDPLKYSIVSGPGKGTLKINDIAGGGFSYAAHAGADGVDSFSFKVSDGMVDSNVATVSVALGGAGRVVLAINAGGPRYVDSKGMVYEADTLYAGGNSYSSTIPIAGTLDDPLYQSERYGDFGYHVPIANGHYMLTLKFAEIYWGSKNQRLFDIWVEEREALSNLDLFTAASKANAYDIRIPVRISDGMLNLVLKSNKDFAKLSGFVVQEMGANFVWGLNAGGTRYLDPLGVLYEHDVLYSGGQTYAAQTAINGTPDGVLYQSERYGTHRYAIPLPAGTYLVTFKFAEIFFDRLAKRSFDVIMEDKIVAAGLDLFAAVGKNQPLEVPILTAVTDGTLDIHFQSIVNNAKVSAILIEKH